MNRFVCANRILVAMACLAATAMVQAAAQNLVPGDTRGTPLLQRDTMTQLLFMDRAMASDCKDRKIVNTAVVEPPKDAQIKGGRMMTGGWKERWSMDRCGTVVIYDVQYTADGKGGTFIAFKVGKDEPEPAYPEATGIDAELLQAAEVGDAARLQDLLAQGANLDARDPIGRNALMITAVKGHAAAATLLLDQGTDVTLRNKYGANALQLAAGNGRADVARQLLAHGANPNEKTGPADEPPMILAAGSGSIETVQALLDGGASFEVRDRLGGTPLSRAAVAGRSAMILFLLDQEAAQERPDQGGKRALLSLGGRCISVEAAQALKDRGGYLQAEMQAVLSGLVTGPTSCFELVKWTVDGGAEVNGQNDYGNTALILSSMWGHREAAKFLLARGADVRLKNRDGLTAIDVAGDRAMRKLLKDGK